MTIRRHATKSLSRGLVALALVLAACPDTMVEHWGARADDARRNEVSVPGLLGAAILYGETAVYREDSGRSSARWRALIDATWRAMNKADAGQLPEADARLLREKVVPLIASLSLALQTAEHFQPWCDAASEEGEAFQHIVKAALSHAPRRVPQSWAGNGDQGYQEFFVQPNRELNQVVARSDCPASYLALSLVSTSAQQALTNLLQMRVVLLPGEVASLQRDPDGYASWLVSNWMPSGLSRFSYGVELRLKESARALAQSMTPEVADQMRRATLDAMNILANDVRRAADAQRDRNPGNPWGDYGGFFPHWCRAEMEKRAAGNVLLHTQTAYTSMCGRSYWDWVPSQSDLRTMVDELGGSVTAYMAKLSEAWAAGDPGTTIKRAAHHNIAGIGAAIEGDPMCLASMCSWIAEGNADRARARFWQNVVMWGTIVVGAVALVTGVGALAVGALGYTALAATLTSVAVVTGYVSTGVTVAGALYLGSAGAMELADAKRDLAAVLVSGAQPARVRADYEHALGLVQGALIDGTLAIADVVVLLRALRASRPAGRAVDALETAIEGRRAARAPRLVSFGADPQAHAALMARHGVAPPAEATLRVGNTSFALGEAFDMGGGRIAVIARVEVDGQAYLRVFYRSNSQVEFRALPAVNRLMGGVHFDKGIGEFSLRVPTEVQEAIGQRLLAGNVRRSIPAEEAVQLYEGGVLTIRNADDLARYANGAADTFPRATNQGLLAEPREALLDGARGNRFRAPGDVVIADANKAPDFGNRVRQYRTQAAVGENGATNVEVTAEVYRSVDGTVEYTVYYESRAQGVWFGSARPIEGSPNTWGLSPTAHDLGEMSMPPWEYGTQIPDRYFVRESQHPAHSSYYRTWQYRREMPEVRRYYEIRRSLEGDVVPATPPG